MPLKLRFRVAVAFACFGGLVSFLLSLGLYLTAHDLGQRLMDETLVAELEDYVARRQRNPHSLPPATVTIVGYVAPTSPSDPEVPPEVLDLSPGWHDLEREGVLFRVAVRKEGDVLFFLSFNKTLHQRREAQFVLFLGLGMLTMTLLSTAGGWWLAGRVIAPITDLARRVNELGLQEPATLADHFLHDEVGQLARVFDRRQLLLQDFIERERAFTADVSHELRTPLAIIQGVVEILLDSATLSDHLRERVERANRAVRDMTVLTSALLLLSRNEETHSRPAVSCRLAEVLREVVEQSRYLLREKPVQVRLGLNADPHLPVACVFLRIVLGNLVRNAFSYTQAGEVTIQLAATDLRVRDTGSGIRAEELSRIFHRHYQGPMSRGAGIGLSLVKRICDQHGWEVTITSQEGQGTEARWLFVSPAKNPSS